MSRDITLRTVQSRKGKADYARSKGKSVNKQPKPLKSMKPANSYVHTKKRFKQGQAGRGGKK